MSMQHNSRLPKSMASLRQLCAGAAPENERTRHDVLYRVVAPYLRSCHRHPAGAPAPPSLPLSTKHGVGTGSAGTPLRARGAADTSDGRRPGRAEGGGRRLESAAPPPRSKTPGADDRTISPQHFCARTGLAGGSAAAGGYVSVQGVRCEHLCLLNVHEHPLALILRLAAGQTHGIEGQRPTPRIKPPPVRNCS